MKNKKQKKAKKRNTRRHGCLDAELRMIKMDYEEQQDNLPNMWIHGSILYPITLTRREIFKQDLRNRLLTVQLEYARINNDRS